jgi:cytochrome b subunit of formate dehydrogenase
LLVAWRPAWDIVMWLLSMLGLTISVSGIVIGWRRLVR